MEKIIEGIVIKTMDYQDSSKIVTLITKDLGTVGLLVRGAKKTTSKLRSATELYTHGEYICFYKKEGLSTLKTVNVKHPNFNIKSDFSKSAFIGYMAEIVYKISKDSKGNPKIYDIFSYAVKKIENGLDEEIITFIFELKILEELGVMPILDGCAICGSSNIAGLSVDHAGLICKNHVDMCEYNFSINTIQTIRKLYYADIKILESVKLNSKTKNEIRKFIDMYYDKHTGLYIKSRTFLKVLRTVS